MTKKHFTPKELEALSGTAHFHKIISRLNRAARLRELADEALLKHGHKMTAQERRIITITVGQDD